MYAVNFLEERPFITGNIPGKTVSYVHNFCNQKVRGNKNQRSINAHNLFGFDFFSF